MPRINGINVPDELMSDEVFSIGLKFGRKIRKKSGESGESCEPKVSGSDIVICGISVDKALFDIELFQIGFRVGKKDNISQVEFNERVYVRKYIPDPDVSVTAPPIPEPRHPVKSCMKQTSCYAPVPVHIHIPVPNYMSNLKRVSPDFPFAIHSIRDPNDFRDIPQTNAIREGYALVYIDPNNYTCYAANTDKFKQIEKLFRINTIQIYEENGRQLSRVRSLNSDGTVCSGFTLTINKRKKILI